MPTGEIRTRSAVAPAASSRVPVQVKGSHGVSVTSMNEPRPTACRAASSSAGCRPKPATFAPSGRATSANTSSPERQAARTPRNAGP